ncbi:MAG: hypothetical protein RIT43_1342 [Bacteroidota bacterium]|jgi:hypothetical protein
MAFIIFLVDYPQIKIETITARANMVYIIPTAAVDPSKKLSDMTFLLC